MNRSESARLAREITEVDKTLTGSTRLLFDPEIEPLAKRSIARQVAEHESHRDELRGALDLVTTQAATDMDDLMTDCRRAFLEAKANFAGLMSPAQMNRFVAEVVGPMIVYPDGRVAQKEAAPENLGAAGIGGTTLFSKQMSRASRDLFDVSLPPTNGNQIGN